MTPPLLCPMQVVGSHTPLVSPSLGASIAPSTNTPTQSTDAPLSPSLVSLTAPCPAQDVPIVPSRSLNTIVYYRAVGWVMFVFHSCFGP